nr:hypothetical protein [Tanacetum cinerariifolium]
MGYDDHGYVVDVVMRVDRKGDNERNWGGMELVSGLGEVSFSNRYSVRVCVGAAWKEKRSSAWVVGAMKTQPCCLSFLQCVSWGGVWLVDGVDDEVKRLVMLYLGRNSRSLFLSSIILARPIAWVIVNKVFVPTECIPRQVKCDNWKALVGSYVVEKKVLLGLEKPIKWVRTVEGGEGDFRRADLQAMGCGGMVGFFFVVVFYAGGFGFLEGENESVVMFEMVCQLTHDNVLFFGGSGGVFKDLLDCGWNGTRRKMILKPLSENVVFLKCEDDDLNSQKCLKKVRKVLVTEKP